jgi:hypothetical protein
MKFGKRLLRIVTIMPSQYREKLFLDYYMLKGNIKDFVNATLAFRNDEPATAAVCASLEDGHNDTSHVLSLRAVEEENTQVGLLTGEEGVQQVEEEKTQVRLITGEEGVQEVEEENTQVGLITGEEDVQEVEEDGTQVGLMTGEEGVQEDAEFNQFMDWIIEENAQSRLTEPEVEENTEAELIESDVGVQELDVEHIELMNWVSIGFPGMAPDVEPIEFIDWVSTAHPGMLPALGLDYGISLHPIWQSVDSWELRSGWWPSYGNEKNSQPLELMLCDGVHGRVEKQGGGLDVDIVEPKRWHSGIEGVDPEVEAFIHQVFHSEGDNAADDAHILSYQVTIFKRMLDGEFFQINKIFVAFHEHNVALMAVSHMGLDIFISSLDQYLSALSSLTFISGNSLDVDM